MTSSDGVNSTPVIDVMMEIRDFVNGPRIQQELMKNRPRWLKLCSAMDVIEDTAMAVRSYSSQDDSGDKGKLYLETYGVLQALKVRQDAAHEPVRRLGIISIQGRISGAG